RERGVPQHIGSLPAEKTATSCVSGPLRAGGAEADPEPPEIGSEVKIEQIMKCHILIFCIIIIN
ncbi:hypothetical protein J8973_27045, partial [Klebsiella pneumoniae]